MCSPSVDIFESFSVVRLEVGELAGCIQSKLQTSFSSLDIKFWLDIILKPDNNTAYFTSTKNIKEVKLGSD